MISVATLPDVATAISLTSDSQIVERLGWMVIHTFWQFTLIAATFSLVSRLAAGQSAAFRHLAAGTSLILMLTCSLVTFSLVTTTAAPHPQVTVVAAAIPPESELAIDPAPEVFQPDFRPATQSVAPPVPQRALVVPAAKPARTDWLGWVNSRLNWLVAAWGLGVGIALFRPLHGLWLTARLKRVGISPVERAVQEVADRLARTLGLKKLVCVMQSQLVNVPAVAGILRPMILLPASVLTGLKPDELAAVLAHELAHIRRFDPVVNFLQSLAETLFFYHPALWWVSHHLREERENCCDDLALAAVGNTRAYGNMLLEIELLRGRVPAALVAANGGSLVRRIRRIVSRAQGRSGDGRGGLASLCAAGTAMALLVGSPWLGRGLNGAEDSPQQSAERRLRDPNQPPAVDLSQYNWAGVLEDRPWKRHDLSTLAIDVRPEAIANIQSDGSVVLVADIKNKSESTIQTLVGHEWHGGEWPPTDLYASVTPVETSEPRLLHEVFQAKVQEHCETLSLGPGKTNRVRLRMDWPGTGSVKTTALMPAKPGRYVVRLALVFDNTLPGTDSDPARKRQFVLGEPRVVEVLPSKAVAATLTVMEVDKAAAKANGGSYLSGQFVVNKAIRPKTMPDDTSLIIGPDGGLANVIVWLVGSGLPAVPNDENRVPKIVMGPQGFAPNVTLVQAPSYVVVENVAKEPLNVAYSPNKGMAFNYIVHAGKAVTPRITSAETIPARLTSHIRPIPHGWVLPLDHSFAAVTDAQGKFRIPDLPQGEWEVRVWHERRGYLRTAAWPKGRFTIQVREGKPIELGAIEVPATAFNQEALVAPPPAVGTPAENPPETKTPGQQPDQPTSLYRPDPYSELGSDSSLGSVRDFFRLVLDSNAGRELSISAEQRQAIQKVSERHQQRETEMQAIFVKEKIGLDANWNKVRQGIWNAVREEADALLRPEQRHAAQLVMQKQRHSPFFQPEIQAALNLSDEQIKRIRSAWDAHLERIKPSTESRLPNHGNLSYRRFWHELTDILTPAQREKFESLRGPAVAIENMSPGSANAVVHEAVRELDAVLLADPSRLYRPDPYPELGTVFELGDGQDAINLVAYHGAAGELHTTPEQREALKTLFRETGKLDSYRMREAVRLGKPVSNRHQERVRIWDDAKQKAWEILTPEQRVRADQLLIQKYGFRGFLRPSLIDALALVPAQVERIRDSIRAHSLRVAKYEGAGRVQFGQDSHRKLWGEIAALLTPEQRERYEAARGEPRGQPTEAGGLLTFQVIEVPRLGQDQAGVEFPPDHVIGTVRGKPVIWQQVDRSQKLGDEIMRLLVSPAISDFMVLHRDQQILTEDELKVALADHEARMEKLEGQSKKNWEETTARDREVRLDDLLESVDKKLPPADVLRARNLAALARRYPGASLMQFIYGNLKWQRFLYRRFGGGRVLFQQAGLEAFDAMHGLMLHLEKEGKFSITEPKLRSLALHYWEAQDHGSFLTGKKDVTDLSLLPVPWKDD